MKRLRWLVLFTFPSLAACAWWMAGRPGLGALDQLVFNHALHKEQGAECSTCHAGITDATDTSASHHPKEAACLDCHDRQNDCQKCHTNPDQHLVLPHESQLGFSHAKHLAQTGVTCAKCHPDGEVATALPISKPSMSLCLTCHNHALDYGAARCQGCHPALNRLPLKAVAEFNHGADWPSQHGLMARAQGQTCLQCHQQSACNECHAKNPAAVNARLYPDLVQRPLLHRADWRSTHAIEARADGDTCARCHRNASFCSDCHKAEGLTPGAANRRNPHPPGYAMPGSSAHSSDARLHIETCAACHDQGAASNCVSCHRVGAGGGNPHPPSFLKRYTKQDTDDQKMCGICHVQ